MSARALRRRYLRDFTGLEKYSRLRAWLIFISFVAQIGVAIAFGHWIISQPISVLSVFGTVLVAIFIGTRMRGLNNIVHECSHATFSVNRKDNTTIGSLCSAILMGSFQDYRDEHLSHHAHLGDYEHDLDLQGIKDLRLHEPLTRESLWRHITNPFLGRHLPYYLRISTSRRDGALYVALKMIILWTVIAFTALYPLTSILFVVLPFALVFTALNYWADCIDHAGLVSEDDDLDASRNVQVPAIVRLVFFPRHDCFHLVHHLFPQVPAQHLEVTHNTLAQDELYQSKQNAIGTGGVRGALTAGSGALEKA